MSHVSNHREFSSERETPDVLPRVRGRDGPLIVFVHGWPELSISWRHQLPCSPRSASGPSRPTCAAMAARVYPRHEDYALQHIVRRHDRLLDRWAATRPSGSVTTGAARSCGAWPAIIPSAATASRTCACRISRKALRRGDTVAAVDRAVYPEASSRSGSGTISSSTRRASTGARAAFEANSQHRQSAVQEGQAARQGQAVAHRAGARDGGWFGGAGRRPTCRWTRTC